MNTDQTTHGNLNENGQNLVRILISSYFIAVALGLINGTDGSVLAAYFLPEAYASFAGSAIVFALAYMVLVGIWLRPAALLLALVLFWSSYIVNFGPEGPLKVGDFWRDLALVGALMMTYNGSPRSLRRRSLWRRAPKVRRIRPDAQVSPRRVAPARPAAVARGTLPQLRSANANENMFVEGFDAA